MYARTPISQRGKVILDKYKKSSLWKHTSAICRALGGFCIAESFMTAVKNPLAINSYFETNEPTDPRQIQRKYQVYGLQRITRHQEVMGFSLFAIGSMMLARRTAADLLIWGLLPVFGCLAAWHQETRVRKYKPAEYFRVTSAIPFAAIVRGDQRMSKVMSELTPTAYAVAFCIMGHTYFWRFA
jgi:uncharacterized membrane protein